MSPFLESLGAAWGSYFGAALVQNTLFLAVVLLVLRRLGGAPASVRSAVATAGVAKLLLPPVLPLRALFQGGSVHPAAGRFMPLSFAEPGGVASPDVAAGTGPGIVALLMVLWAAGAILLLAWTVVSAARFSRLLRDARPAPRSEVPGIASRAGVEILVSPRIAMPLTFGVFARRIYVPAGTWNRWTRRSREMVVRHELAHISRRDGAVQVLQAAARSIYFFHPLVWLLDRRLGEYREMACDDLSTRGEDAEASEYSRFLVETAASLAGPRPTGMTASAFIRRRNELLRRVRYQLAEGGVRMMSIWKKTILAACLVILAAALSWHQGEVSAQDSRPAQGGAGEESPSSVHITATLKNDGSIVMVTKSDSWKTTDLAKAFTGHMEYDSEHTVIDLHCEDEVTMDRVYAFQAEMQKRGISRIRYATHEDGGVPLQLPPREMIDRLAEMPPEMLCRVYVDGAGAIGMGGKTIRGADVGRQIGSCVSSNEAIVVVIETDEDTPFSAFVTTLAAVTGAGAQRVAIMPPTRAAE